MEDRLFLAFDIGGTHIKYALITENAKILEQGEKPTPKTDLEDFMKVLADVLAQYQDRDLAGIAMAAPGRIDSDSGYFYTGGALMYLHQADMAGEMKKITDLPFTVINDAKAAALAELWKGSLKGADSGIVITLGTGIGGALIVDGRLWQGHTSAAGEFSPVPVNWNSRCTGFGDCWTDINCTRSLTDRYAIHAGKDPQEVNGRVFFEALEANDQAARDELEWFAETMATALYGLQLILDVEKICIGGGISRQPALLETLNAATDRLYERVPFYSPASRPEISACTFFNDANLIGALYRHLQQDPS